MLLDKVPDLLRNVEGFACPFRGGFLVVIGENALEFLPDAFKFDVETDVWVLSCANRFNKVCAAITSNEVGIGRYIVLETVVFIIIIIVIGIP